MRYTTLCNYCGAPSMPISIEFDEEIEEFEGLRSELPTMGIFNSNWMCPTCNLDNRDSLHRLYRKIERDLNDSNSLDGDTVRDIVDKQHKTYIAEIYERTIASKPASDAHRIVFPRQHKRYKVAGNRGAECKTCHNITLLEKGPLSIQICQSCGEPLRLTTQDVIVI